MSALSSFDVAGQVVIVTGAGRGIGRALAIDLAASSALVVACSRTKSDLDTLETEARAFGGSIITIVADVSKVEGFKLVLAHAIEAHGRVDGLVNNVGWNRRRHAVDYTEAEVDDLLDLNLKAAYWACVLVAKQMILQGGGGSMVNVTSQAGILGSPDRAPYSAAKAGLINLTRAFAAEWGREGIRVNAVAPGVTLTPNANKSMSDRPVFAAEVEKRVLLGRAAEPREVSAPIVFLLSPAASMITGHTLVVDGGWTAAWSVSSVDDQ